MGIIHNICLQSSTIENRTKSKMAFKVGDTFPNMQFETTEGNKNFYDWMGDQWAVFCSYPSDFNPVCMTEMSDAGNWFDQFKRRCNNQFKMMWWSMDNMNDHKKWMKDVQYYKNWNNFPFPLVAGNKQQCDQMGWFDPEEKDNSGNMRCGRNVYIVGPDKKVKMCWFYPGSCGRNWNEIFRACESVWMNWNYKNRCATPANWKSGDRCFVKMHVNDHANCIIVSVSNVTENFMLRFWCPC